jgi:hypothetical protein
MIFSLFSLLYVNTIKSYNSSVIFTFAWKENLRSNLKIVCMKKRNLFKISLLGVLLTGFTFTACEYQFVEPEQIILPDDPISFATEIQPVFNSKCNTCHTVTSPVLTDGNAYQNLMSGGYIDLNNPESSVIYVKVSSGHPGGSSAFNSTERAILLKWIQEGAENN